MMKNIIGIILIFIIGNVNNTFAQKHFEYEISAGINGNNYFLNSDFERFDRNHNTSISLGFDIKNGISYHLNKKNNLKFLLLYSYYNINYNFNDEANSMDAFIDSTRWEIISKITSHDIGFSLGFEHLINDKLSIGLYGIYKNNIYHLTEGKVSTNVNLQWITNELEFKDSSLSKFATSIEFKYKFSRRFNVNSGFEYYLSKDVFYPTENKGRLYKINCSIGYVL